MMNIAGSRVRSEMSAVIYSIPFALLLWRSVKSLHGFNERPHYSCFNSAQSHSFRVSRLSLGAQAEQMSIPSSLKVPPVPSCSEWSFYLSVLLFLMDGEALLGAKWITEIKLSGL